MANLPAASSLTNLNVTEAGFKEGLTKVIDYVGGTTGNNIEGGNIQNIGFDPHVGVAADQDDLAAFQ